MLADYLKLFQKLRTDRNRTRWPSFTTGRAPHKPFLLLSIMDLIGQGLITSNFIEPTFDLVDTFKWHPHPHPGRPYSGGSGPHQTLEPEQKRPPHQRAIPLPSLPLVLR